MSGGPIYQYRGKGWRRGPVWSPSLCCGGLLRFAGWSIAPVWLCDCSCLAVRLHLPPAALAPGSLTDSAFGGRRSFVVLPGPQTMHLDLRAIWPCLFITCLPLPPLGTVRDLRWEELDLRLAEREEVVSGLPLCHLWTVDCGQSWTGGWDQWNGD